MDVCYKSGDFQKYFKENMDGLGMPVPSTMFDTYQSAIAHASVMVGTLHTLGPGATIAELIGATTGLEMLAVAASFGAAGYVGAFIGSIAVASGRSISCGSRIADFFVFIERNNLRFKGDHQFYRINPEVFDPSIQKRASFAAKAKATPATFEYA